MEPRGKNLYLCCKIMKTLAAIAMDPIVIVSGSEALAREARIGVTLVLMV